MAYVSAITYNSEVDPLLPQTPRAPEISGYGTRSKSSAEVTYKEFSPTYQEPSPTYQDVSEEREDEDSSATAGTSTRFALSTIISIFTVVVFFAFVSILLAPDDDGSKWPLPLPKRPSGSVEARVQSIMKGTPLFDGHNDLAIFVRGNYQNQIHTKKFKNEFEKGGMPFNVDLPRLRKGMAGGAFWSAFVVCPEDASTDFSDQNYAESVSHTLSQIDLLRRIQAQYPSDFTHATAPLSEHLERFLSDMTIMGPISIEGLHQVPPSSPLSTLRLYYSLGVRAATLTWNCHNAFADAALIWSKGDISVAPYHRGGLTDAGRDVVQEMNRLGMLIDVSHTSYWTQKAVLSNGTSAAPVIFSHSSAFALCQHPRNVQDDILDLVKKTSSLVMVNFSPAFISCLAPPDPLTVPEFYEKNNTLHQVARHITYIGDRIGYDFVGIGSDFDGMGELTPKGLEGVDKYPDLIAELLHMGVSDKNASKVVGGNLLRVWREADKVAAELKAKEHEGEDEVHGWQEVQKLVSE